MNKVTANRRTPSTQVDGALLDAAARLLSQEGPGALSVRRIATEAGTAPMSVYNRFGNKQGVVFALFRDGFATLAQTLRTINADDPIGALLEAGRRYRQFALQHPAQYALMFDRVVPEFHPSQHELQCGDEAFSALVDLVRRAADTGHIDPGDATEIAWRYWASCHGAVSLELRGIRSVTTRDARYETLLNTIIRGLGGQPTVTKPSRPASHGRAPTVPTSRSRPR